MFHLAICLIFIAATTVVGQELERPLRGDDDKPLSTRVNLTWKDIDMPWGELTPPLSITGIVDELVLPEVSGKDMGAKAKAFQQLWNKHLEEREAIAAGLGRLAREFEEVDEFDKALILYEKIWEVFPEQSDVIGEIKWEHATHEVEIDLSSPEKAFLSLKRALLTYKLTGATFGIADASTILYKPRPVELSDLDIFPSFEGRLDIEPKDNEWPEPVPNAWWDASRYGMGTNMIDLKVENVTKLDVIEVLKKEHGVPLVLTPAAGHTLAKDSKRLTFELKNIPVKELLKYVLRSNESDVLFVERVYSLLVYNRKYDKPDRLMTAVLQYEPWGFFPDENEAYDESYSKEVRVYLEGFLGEFLGIDKFPDEWETYFGYVGILKAPAEVSETWHNLLTIPSAGKYFGRTHPLLSCLRAYPLVGPVIDRYEGHPRKRYQYMIQVHLQTQRMHRFLSDRLAIIALLKSEFLGVKEGAKNRYEPHISLGWIADLSSRIGLWFDGNNYRFLVFDSEEDRDRWLKGEDWVDVPSDIDQHDWPTEEEWQERLRREKEEDEKQIHKSVD